MLLSRKLFYLLLAAPVYAARDCYFPDGSLAVDDVPCFSGIRDTHCCSKSSICMTNGYCLVTSQPYTLARGTCTDKNWSSSSGCPDPCSKIASTRKTGCSIPLHSFVNRTALYCANAVVANSSSSTACAGDTEPFTINRGDIIIDSALLARASCTVPRLDPSSPGNDIIHASAMSAPVELQNASKTYVAIGAGVGVPLGVLAIGAIGWALYERRKRLRLIETYASQPVAVHQPMYQQETQPVMAHPYEMPPDSKPSHLSQVPQELGNENR
ncbi:hypothetical protein GTR04_7036 [Trichophyton interdigitale]|nr:hypothetical protein GY631_2842 [Trichophyton interdigitale]KAG5217081.1 hypothetical protein GY632_6910 [Trichophyton interdigitale]KAG8205582.1 hypothetical protein GTR04_7036 [Trichophyton interdigitale]